MPATASDRMSPLMLSSVSPAIIKRVQMTDRQRIGTIGPPQNCLHVKEDALDVGRSLRSLRSASKLVGNLGETAADRTAHDVRPSIHRLCRISRPPQSQVDPCESDVGLVVHLERLAVRGPSRFGSRSPACYSARGIVKELSVLFRGLVS